MNVTKSQCITNTLLIHSWYITNKKLDTLKLLTVALVNRVELVDGGGDGLRGGLRDPGSDHPVPVTHPDAFPGIRINLKR